MDQNIFKAGVRPGGPASQTEIKMLLCYALTAVDRPLSFEQLYDALSEDSLVNYFDLVGVLDQLEESEHLEIQSSDNSETLFSMTDLGKLTGKELSSSLPISTRERAVQAVNRVLEREQRLKEINIQITPAESGGYIIKMEIPQENDALISFSIFAPTEMECNLIRKRFLNAPKFIYKGVLALLTGDKSVQDEIFPSENNLLF